MREKMRMIYWKGEKFWLGKLREHPEIMTQGRTLKELEENLKDAYHMVIMANRRLRETPFRRACADACVRKPPRE
jgi:predicted RNase H-like HicB family nuclease